MGWPIKSKVFGPRVSDWQPDKISKNLILLDQILEVCSLTLSHDFDWWTGITTTLL